MKFPSPFSRSTSGQIQKLQEEIERLRKEIEAYQRRTKLLEEVVSPLTSLGIQDRHLREALKPMFDAYVPVLKEMIENEKQKQRAAFRSEGRTASSAI